MDELRRRGEERRVSFEPTMAGSKERQGRNGSLARFRQRQEKLKAAEPWLFSAPVSVSAPAEATGLPNAGAATDAGAPPRRS